MNPKKPKARPRQSGSSSVKIIAPSRLQSQPSTTLLAVVGVSPAILTETVWALAQGDSCSPAVIPEDVVAITTLRGQESITRGLLTASLEFGGRTVWQALRQDLLGAGTATDSRLTLRVVIIERRNPTTGLIEPLSDIRDRDENLAAAEFILGQVRQHTTAKDRRLIASLAGGRKTMSALLHAAFSHLGRPEDRLTHILVNEPFDSPDLTPRFFYPAQPAQVLTGRDGVPRQARDAKLELADVPFAPLRVRFPDIADIPTRFRDLVQTYGETFKRDAAKPAAIELLHDPPRVVVDGMSVELEGERPLAVIRFLLEANQKQWLQKDQVEAAEIFKAWNGYKPELTRVRNALRSSVGSLYEQKRSRPGDSWIDQADSNTIKRPLSFLRRELVRKGSAWIPPQRDLRLPPFRLAGVA